MDVFRRFWWFWVPLLLLLLGCTVTKRYQSEVWKSKPEGVWRYEEKAPEGQIIEKTVEINPFKAVDVFVALGEAVIEGAGRLGGGVIGLFTGLIDLFADREPRPAPPGEG